MRVFQLPQIVAVRSAGSTNVPNRKWRQRHLFINISSKATISKWSRALTTNFYQFNKRRAAQGHWHGKAQPHCPRDL